MCSFYTEPCLRTHQGAKVPDVEDAVTEFLKQYPFKPGGAKYKVNNWVLYRGA